MTVATRFGSLGFGSLRLLTAPNVASERDPPGQSRLTLPRGDLSLEPTRHLDPSTLNLKRQQLLEHTPVVGRLQDRASGSPHCRQKLDMGRGCPLGRTPNHTEHTGVSVRSSARLGSARG